MGLGRSGRRAVAVLAIAGLGLALSACGDDDDENPAAAADEGGDNADKEEADTAEAQDAGDNTETEAQDEGNDDETVEVDDLNDIPEECRELLGDFLKEIEPFVEDVDWENADLSALEDISSELDSVVSEMDEEMSDADCDQYELEGDVDMDSLIEMAEDEAPGTVAYFEFIKQMQEGFADVTIPDVSMPDITIPDVTMPDAGEAADVPQDCDGAIAYLEDLMDQYDSMTAMPISELSNVGAVTSVITSQCSVNQMNEFYNDPEVSAWMSGT